MMATTRTERRDSGGVLWLAALLLAALLAVLGRVHPASVADVMLTEHATERHGTDAERAIDLLVGAPEGAGFDWRCPDNKRLRAVQDRADGRWGVLLTVEIGGVERRITSLMMRARGDVFKWAEKNGCHPNGLAY
jgi:hypothetical protein